jgi:hypothetical protein
MSVCLYPKNKCERKHRIKKKRYPRGKGQYWIQRSDGCTLINQKKKKKKKKREGK